MYRKRVRALNKKIQYVCYSEYEVLSYTLINSVFKKLLYKYVRFQETYLKKKKNPVVNLNAKSKVRLAKAMCNIDMLKEKL